MEKDIPSNCPGTNTEKAGKTDACEGCPNKKICSTQNPDTMKKQAEELKSELSKKLDKIKHKLLVLSGKGGVGKSTVSSQLAFYLAHLGYEVGLLDLDLCGPSIPKMMGIENQDMFRSNSGWSPVYVRENLGVVSIGFMLPNKDDAVIWRGPKKNGLIKQFIMDVDWGELDFLIIDTPPGTSDEHISIVQYLNLNDKTSQDHPQDGAILVTTGQQVSINDVRKEVSFCKKTGINIIGIVENMKHLLCGNCGSENLLFGSKSESPYKKLLDDFSLKDLGAIGFSSFLLNICENGKSIWNILYEEDEDEDEEENKIVLSEKQKQILTQISHEFEAAFNKALKDIGEELTNK